MRQFFDGWPRNRPEHDGNALFEIIVGLTWHSTRASTRLRGELRCLKAPTRAGASRPSRISGSRKVSE